MPKLPDTVHKKTNGTGMLHIDPECYRLHSNPTSNRSVVHKDLSTIPPSHREWCKHCVPVDIRKPEMAWTVDRESLSKPDPKVRPEARDTNPSWINDERWIPDRSKLQLGVES